MIQKFLKLIKVRLCVLILNANFFKCLNANIVFKNFVIYIILNINALKLSYKLLMIFNYKNNYHNKILIHKVINNSIL